MICPKTSQNVYSNQEFLRDASCDLLEWIPKPFSNFCDGPLYLGLGLRRVEEVEGSGCFVEFRA